MCHPARCTKCGKTTWAGCGRHVDQVMRRVAPEDRCTCPTHTPQPGLLRRLFGAR